jgi:hypothetical protein
LPTLVRKLDSLEGNLLLRRMKDARAGPRKKPLAN